MTTTLKMPTYNLEFINDLIFKGFQFTLPADKLQLINELSAQVGVRDCVKQPVFQNTHQKQNISVAPTQPTQKKRRGKNELQKQEEFELLKNFKATKAVEKVGIDAEIDAIRALLNKLTDKNYIDIRNKVIDIIDKCVETINATKEEIARLGSTIFEIASTNRFYSKMYADLYSDLSTKYDIISITFEENLEKFTELFSNIEYVDPDVNYDKFCEINKINEKRKSLCAFYVNLTMNRIISNGKQMEITKKLLVQLYNNISMPDKKNEVDELTENIAILYKKEIYNNQNSVEQPKIDGYTITELINKIAKSKVKDYKSLTNKALFKFMDMIEI